MSHYIVTAAAVFIPAASRGQAAAMLYRGARIPERTPAEVVRHFLDNKLIEEVGAAAYQAAPQEAHTTSGPDAYPAAYNATSLPDSEYTRTDH
ncbi:MULTISPECIES: hypothetical protein [Rhodococcus]|uniref:hypothetical protein n=1 Tax=Rhodococcus TaxID=1827 RepID=UPI000C9CAF75|nr:MULTISPECIES: hypothetical protein [Rhodococcus]PND52549.1 hypothetical protein CQZ88_08075 [Rhodococcus sp. ENV425]WKX00255.1 hypothetical protein Q3O43_08150 [Rhodococcus aetherivorans]